MLLLAMLVALAAPAPAKPTVVALPGQHYTLQAVKLRGKHWAVGRTCGRVQISLRLPSGKVAKLGPARVTAAGRFVVTWRAPRYVSGHVRVNASETCSGRPALRAKSTFTVLPTP